MPAEVLKDVKEIAKRIKYKYAKKLHRMTFVFCYKGSDGKSFIFQELTSVPIQRFVHHPSNDSISFTAGWSAWGNPYSLVADGRHGGAEVWSDLFDRSKPNNTNINQFGTFDSEEWTLINRSNTHEKIKKKKTKFDTVFEFRTDRVERVCFYPNWFEVISSSLSFIAIDPHMLFPYKTDTPGLPGFSADDLEDGDYEDYSNEDTHLIRFNGRSFDFNVKNPGIIHTPDAYWDRNESDPKNKEFDEYLVRTLIEGNWEVEGSINVGQRKTNLYFGD
jgi:hypothetical protein